MALNFPNSPTPGQVYDAPNGVRYKWNGYAWAPDATAYAFKASRAAAQAIPANTATRVIWTAADFNQGGIVGVGSPTVTIPARGLWQLYAQIGFQNSPQNSVQAQIWLNGAVIAQGVTSLLGTGNFDVQGQALWFGPLSAGDTVEVYAQSEQAINVQGGTAWNYFAGMLVR